MATDKVWAWMFVFLLALSPAFAVEDFTATGTARVLAFACSPAEGEITVSNTGDVPSAYEIIAEGEARDWVMFVPETFTLGPGQTQRVQEFFAIPCDAEDRSLDVIIATTDLELVLTQDIIVQTPNNLELIPQVFTQSVLPCDAADFSFTLHNPAEFAETYRLKLLDAPDEAALSDETLTLLPNTNKTIAVTIRPTDCTLSGEFTPVLLVTTEKSRIQAEIEMFLQINDSDIPELAPGVKTIRAGFAAQEAGFDIVNTGDRITTYLLSIDGPTWISVQPEQVTIDPRDREKAKLVLQPTEAVPPGTYPITLTAEVETTGTQYTKEFIIKLGPPTLTEQLTTTYLPFTIAGIVVLVIILILIYRGIKKWRSPEFQAKLAERRAERERRRQEKIALKEQRRREREEEKKRKDEEKRAKEEADAKEVERKERELERERLKAQKEYDKQLRKEHLVIPKDDIITGIARRGKRILKIALLVLILILVLLGIAFQDTVARNAQALLTGIIVLLVILVLHRLRRRRVARGTWKLALANKVLLLDTKWRKGLTQISFKLNNVIKKLAVAVRRRRPSVAAPSGHVYQTFAITHNAETEGDVVKDVRLKFCIKKSWLLKHNVPPSSVRLMRLDEDRWQSIAAEPVSADKKFAYFVADADGFGEFAIVGKPGKRVAKPTRAHAWGKNIGIAAFIIIAVVALVSLVALLPSPTPTVGIPAQVWKQDTQHTLDLGTYFKDPDNDPLTFSATRTEHIDISIVGSKAVLTPDFGWSGTERTVFIADDGKGGIVKSNLVQLVVEPPVIPKTWKRYAGPILTIAIIILVVLGAFFFRKRIKKAIGLEE